MPKRQGGYNYKKPAISLREDIYFYAKNKAEEDFAGNLSGYISYLISQDKKGIRVSEVSYEVKETVSATKDIDLDKPVPKAAMDALDAVMNFEG